MMWAAGTAAAAAVVAYWQIVGPGYTWLTASLVASIGFGGWFFGPRPLLLVASGLAVGAVVLARRGVAAALLLGLATVSFLVEAFGSGAPLLALSGSVALGGITAEMLLGHWYLISPQMPRWALRRLDVAAAVGVGLDVVLLVLAGALAGISGLGVAVFGGLAGMSVLLMIGVWYSLKEPSYPGVMAATGLSYLAVLTSLGATALGRTLLDGSSTFLPFDRL